MPLHSCSIHKDELLSWVCLEKECKDRLLCSKCAIKVHEKSHKLEELTTLKEKGFKNLIANGLFDAKEFTFDFLDMHSGLLDVEKSFKAIVQEVGDKYGEATHLLYKCKEETLQAIESKFQSLRTKDHELGYRNLNPDELSTHIQASLDLVEEIENPTNYENFKILKSKEKLLNIASASLLSTLLQFQSNVVNQTLITSFKGQLDTITGKALKDEKFIKLIESKWESDAEKVSGILNKGFQDIKRSLQTCNEPASLGRAKNTHQPDIVFQSAPHHGFYEPIYHRGNPNRIMIPPNIMHHQKPSNHNQMFASPKLRNNVTSLIDKIEGAKMCDSQILTESNQRPSSNMKGSHKNYAL